MSKNFYICIVVSNSYGGVEFLASTPMMTPAGGPCSRRPLLIPRAPGFRCFAYFGHNNNETPMKRSYAQTTSSM